jgi:acyl homoserine lactone synthase
MIHLVHAGNRSLYARELDQMFRLRAKFFKELLGWSALTVEGGRETDAYDDDEALYLLAIEADGAISVSVRLRPTREHSLLLDHFPHLLAEDPKTVATSGVWESCRYFASSRARGPEGARRREELRLAMVEAARLFGVRRIVAITDTAFLAPLLQASWTTRLLGLPAAYAEGECIALEIDCSETAYLRMQERLGVPGQVLIDLEPDLFPPALPPHEIERLIAGYGVPAAEAIELLKAARQLTPEDLGVVANITRRADEIGRDEGWGAAAADLEAVTEIVRADNGLTSRPRLAAVEGVAAKGRR